MDEYEAMLTLTEALLDTLDRVGVLGKVVNEAVNGTDEACLGWHDETDTDRAVVCAAFQVLGQEIANHCHPIVAIMAINELVNLRDSAIEAMKEAPL